MYAKKYSFWNDRQFPGFQIFLSCLFDKSKREYFKDLKSSRSLYSNREYLMIESILNDLETYYFYLLSLGIVDEKNFKTVLEQLKSISSVRILPEGARKCYGLTVDKSIFINPDIPSSYGFGSEDMMGLVVSHEAGHIINQVWKGDMEEFCSVLYENKHVKELLESIGLNSKKYLEYGFSLLDEVVSEDVAERILYKKTGKGRPSVTVRYDKKVFGYQPYESNFLYYGELQEMAVKFARKMKFINSKASFDESLKRLGRLSFSRDFIFKVQEGFFRDRDTFDSLVIMLVCMGKVREATYQIIGLEQSTEDVDVHTYLDIFRYYSDGVGYKVLEKEKN